MKGKDAFRRGVNAVLDLVAEVHAGEVGAFVDSAFLAPEKEKPVEVGDGDWVEFFRLKFSLVGKRAGTVQFSEELSNGGEVGGIV